jgi:hypothetical protein
LKRETPVVWRDVIDISAALRYEELSHQRLGPAVAFMKALTSVATLLLTLPLLSPSSAQDKKLASVTVGYSAISGSFAPLWVGFDQGLFARYGLDVRMTYIQAIGS